MCTLMNEKKREAYGFSLGSHALTILVRWVIVVAVCAIVAHGCHPGDHDGDADLLSWLIAAEGS